jgi:hypothetical protein
MPRESQPICAKIWVVVKTDDRGRTIDIHALRHTFGAHLS